MNAIAFVWCPFLFVQKGCEAWARHERAIKRMEATVSGSDRLR